MRRRLALISVLLVSASLPAIASASARLDPPLDAARQLYDKQEYAAASEALQAVQREGLSSSEQKEYDRLTQVLPDAVAGQEKSLREKSEADKAFDAGRLNQADQLYASILMNRFATTKVRTEAAQQRKRIAGQRSSGSASAAEVKPVSDVQPAGDSTSSLQSGTTGTLQPMAPAPAQQTPPAQPAPPANSGTSAGTGVPPAPQGIIEELQSRDELLWQRAVAKMEEAAVQIEEAIAAERFDEARRLAETALQMIEANRGFAQPASKYENARQRAMELKARVETAYEQYSIESARREQEEIARLIEERRAQQEQQRREKVDQLFRTADQLDKERRFREAAEAMRQVMYIDPANTQARFLLENYEELAGLSEQQSIRSDYERESQAVMLQADETRIPWNYDVLYPRNWLDISARRDKTGIPRPGEDFELNRRLEDVQSEISVENEPFDHLLGNLVELNDMNLAVDWEDLRDAGVEPDTPVSLNLKDVKLRTVLREVLSQAGGRTPLGYAVSDGLLRIATRDKLSRDKFVMVHDVRDLIIKIPRFREAPVLDTHTAPSVPTADASMMFANSIAPAPDPRELGAALAEDQTAVAQLIDMIRSMVEPDSWREVGGGDAAIRELNGELIVYNTSDAHQQIRDLLGQLREQRALMISVESRFLTVGSNFLEEIGVDLDFVFNAGEAGFDPAFNAQQAPIIDPFTGAQTLLPREFSRIGALPATPPFGNPLTQGTPAQPYFNSGLVPSQGGIPPSFNDMTPIPVQQGTLGLADPSALNTGIPGSIAQSSNFGPAMQIAGSYLDNLQVDFLIRATQANRRSSIAQAPRLMLFNGQRAWVAIRRSRQYVSTVTPTVAEGAVGVQPQLAQIDSGTVLDVEGTISADRKYVTLTVRTGLSEEPTLDRFQVQQASGNSPGIFVTTTDQVIRSLRTTVSVPDGGTVLLGGLKQSGEVEIEAGVPILSKIPILKRAFTNTSTVKDTQTLLILLKAKILIQREAEEEAFPTLSSASPG